MNQIAAVQTDTIPDVSSRVLDIYVVAVKWPGHWIVRGIKVFASFNAVTALVRPYVAAAPPEELQWTRHCYEFPGWFMYDNGDLSGFGWPGGPNGSVYLFPFNGATYDVDTYRGTVRRLGP